MPILDQATYLFSRKTTSIRSCERSIAAFLNHLAINHRVAASTQTQALKRDRVPVSGRASTLSKQRFRFNRIQQRQRVPVILTPREVAAILNNMRGTCALMARLMFGSGLRVQECCTLRVKDLDFGAGALTVRSGKGAKDRTTVMPEAIYQALQVHLLRVAQLHVEDRNRGGGLAPMPGALERKYPNALASRPASPIQGAT